MTREEIIQGLQFTIDMFLLDPTTGELITKPRNDMDKTTIDACKGAIELLEQQPCENAISRDDALKALAYDIESFEFKSGVGKHMNEIAKLLNTIYEIQSNNIKALPPVQPKPKTGHWTPISERPPEESGTYTVTAYDGATKRVTYIKYLKRLKQWELTGSRAYWKVLAWMPLPKPYELQESEE